MTHLHLGVTVAENPHEIPLIQKKQQQRATVDAKWRITQL